MISICSNKKCNHDAVKINTNMKRKQKGVEWTRN